MDDRRQRLDRLDEALASWMGRYGHRADRLALGSVFVWFGLLKVLGEKSATSIIADTVYLGSPEVTARLLGLWEVAIGGGLLISRLTRLAIALLMIRLPGTAAALALKRDICWTETLLVPTIQGQYLVKDLLLFTAAMIIGGSVTRRRLSSTAS